LNKYPDNRHLNLIIGIDRQYAAKILSRTVFLCKFITGIGKQLPENIGYGHYSEMLGLF
jgi:hypothetical protein